jgi:uncharacterized membrane protein
LRSLLRCGLAAIMLVAGVAHLITTDRFLGQLPTWLPLRTTIVQISGVVEIGFALALVLARRRRREVGRALAVFFVAIFPANLYQAIAGTSAFGLDTPAERWGRLLIQPLLVLAALWSTDRSAGGTTD